MSTQLGNGSITYGDGTVQTTATPTNVSAFANDSNFYRTPSDIAASHARKDQAIGSISVSPGYSLTLWGDDVNGNHITGGFYNCNCNC